MKLSIAYQTLSRPLVAAVILVWLAALPMPAAAQSNAGDEVLRQTLIALIQKLLADEVVVDRAISTAGKRLESDQDDMVGHYEVEDGSLVPVENTRRVSSLHQEYWDGIMAVVPESYWPQIGEFLLFDGDEDEFDGYVETLYADNNSVWRLAINSGTIDRPRIEGDLFAELIIHEFAHILTLDHTQIDGETSSMRCDTIYIEEGCAEEDSYFYQFVEEFWSDGQLERTEAISDMDNPEAALANFFAEYEDEFVTDYAATNPIEDLAETFTYFIMYDRPTGDAVYQQKIESLYAYPELVRLRTPMRATSLNSN